MKHLDTKTLNFLIYCCMFWKAICPFLGFAYIVGWLTLIFEDPIHLIINDAIGWLPALIDGLFLHQTSIFGDEYRMGYVYSAALIILSMYFAFKLQIHLNDCKMTKENEVKIIEVKKIKRNNDVKRKPVDDTHRYTHFFGLLELNLEYLIEDGKSSDQLIKLKNVYLNCLVYVFVAVCVLNRFHL